MVHRNTPSSAGSESPTAASAAWNQGEGIIDAAIYKTDAFRISAFKVLLCSNRAAHDWKCCPFAHPGEHAKRRPLDKFRYSADMCHSARRGVPCPLGDACPHAHHVFEMWLHPDRYRTQMCEDGEDCKRKVCFFAHNLSQLRTPPAATSAPAPASPLSSISVVVPSTPAQPAAQPAAAYWTPSAGSPPPLPCLPSPAAQMLHHPALLQSAPPSPPAYAPAPAHHVRAASPQLWAAQQQAGSPQLLAACVQFPEPGDDLVHALRALLLEADAGQRAASAAAAAARRAGEAAASAADRLTAFAAHGAAPEYGRCYLGAPAPFGAAMGPEVAPWEIQPLIGQLPGSFLGGSGATAFAAAAADLSPWVPATAAAALPAAAYGNVLSYGPGATRPVMVQLGGCAW